MKARLLVWFSLGLNLLLLAVVCHFALRRPVPRPVPREVRQTPRPEPDGASTTETNPALAVTTPGVEAFSWAQLASADFKVYRDRLRAIGCPEETVRDIILAEINEKFRPRRAEIVASVQGRYWEVAAKGRDAFDQWEDPLKKLNEEQQALITEVLGDEPEDPTAVRERQTRSWKDQYAWLPPEKQSQLVELELQNQERSQAIWAEIGKRPGGEATAEERQKLKTLKDELVAARERLLTPDELLEYRLRNSSVSGWALNLPGFEATETEWRAVGRLKLEYDEALRQLAPEGDENFRRRYGMAGAGTTAADTAEATDVRRRLEAELNAAVNSALGPERSAEYELAGNSDYQQTRQIIERYQLPEALAQQAYEIQRAAAAGAEATRTAANLSAEARASALAAIRQETERALAATLGLKVFNTYQEYHGDWLKQLNQTPGN